MNIIPIESKQIAYVAYDEQAFQMTAHYHTGEVRTYPSIQKNDFEQFLASSNKYDYFVQITTHKTI